jgi:hypothetical protein
LCILLRANDWWLKNRRRLSEGAACEHSLVQGTALLATPLWRKQTNSLPAAKIPFDLAAFYTFVCIFAADFKTGCLNCRRGWRQTAVQRLRSYPRT